MTRVLIVDDSTYIREGIVALLSSQSDMEVVGEASNGKEGISSYHRYRPDVVLMDVSMPIMDGVAATQAICAEFPEAYILLFSNLSEEEAAKVVVSSGAKGYIDKAASRQELFCVLREVWQTHFPTALVSD